MFFSFIDLAKIVLISYATDREFRLSKVRFELQAKNFFNFDKIKIYGPDDLPKDFAMKYESILARKRGAGYWIWRIKLIEDELKQLNYGDILLFVDVGCIFKKKYLSKFHELINTLKKSEKSILAFELSYPEKKHTKVEIFDFFNISKSSWIRESKQLQATVLFLKKTENLNKYVYTYLKAISEEPELITDKLWKEQESIFKENRHDQSLHSVICKLTNISIIIPDFLNHRKTPIMATRLRDVKMLKIIDQHFE